MRRSILVIVALIFAHTLPAFAQETATPTAPQNTAPQTTEQPAQETAPAEIPPAMQAFGKMLASAESALRSGQAYRVRVDAEWLSLRNGQIDLSGENQLLLVSGGNGRLRLEARQQQDQPAQYLVVADGRNLTRIHTPSAKFSRDVTNEPLTELAGCEITQSILDICGSRLLLTAQVKDSVFQILTQVADLGDDANLRHFQLGLADGRVADVWFTETAPHLPVKLITREVNSVSQELKQELQITANFDWELNAQVADTDFQFAPTAEYQLVSNLADTLAGQGSEELVGKPLPKFTLTNLQGQAVAIENENRPVLLYFWATWAAPTTEDLPGVVEFAKQLEGQGVRVVAVNVAEDKDQIAAFLEANKVVLDVAIDKTGEVIHDLRITELPAVVIVDKQHQVRGIYEEVTKDIRPKLAEELKKIMSEQK
jgi:cytochrome c biogenesis protein CcmG/thiol:disulfide interchange protein DsbE